MSDYSQITSFGPKDSLITGNPAKLVKGTEYDAEFSAISTAIATKFDSGDIAADADIDAGTSNAKLVTPAGLTRALDALDIDPADEILTAVKTADTSRSSTTSYTADPDLSIAVEANTRYMVQGYVEVTGSTFGAKFQFGVPSGATANANLVRYDADGVDLVNAPISSSGDRNFNLDGNPSSGAGFFMGILTVGATPGNFTLKWAQTASSGNATTLKANSYLTVKALG